MNHVRRILEEDPSAAERLLLASASIDSPPPDGRARVLVALGLAASVGTAASSASAATVATTGPVIAKWVAMGALGGAVMASSVAVVTRHALSESPAAQSAQSAPPRPEHGPAVTERRQAPAALATARAAVTPAAPAVRETLAGARHVERRIAHDDPTSATTRSLSDEIDVLDRARRALASHDPGGALRLLDAHDSDFPAPRLSQEATVLRVEALFASGRGNEGRRLGELLLRDEPSSAHAKRIRSLLDDSNAGH
ncbi:MAG TPA: hypothetical protein VHU80_02225 [Polyangiaceae bacterium]|nr:hypothetical protein [Polyangiaceae bacterium]